MNGWFDRNWQAHWSDLADRLELALDNSFYRLIMCLATVGLIIAYVVVSARLAQPPRFTESPWLRIESARELEYSERDSVNRAIVRLDKIASVLDLRPTSLAVDLDVAIDGGRTPLELHVLRLWIDEARGFPALGMFELVPESVARTVLVTLFPSRFEAEFFDPSLVGSSWFEQVRSMRETCRDSQARGVWRELCSDERANPMSLVNWLSSATIASMRSVSVVDRVAGLKTLVQRTSDPELLKLEGVGAWPTDSKLFDRNIRTIVQVLLPEQARGQSFIARQTYTEIDLAVGTSVEKQVESLGEVKRDLVVVRSCESPRVKDIAVSNLSDVARDVIWVQDCEMRQLKTAVSADAFAIANPGVPIIQLGVRELDLALAQGWISSETDLTLLASAVRGSTNHEQAARIQAQRVKWDERSKVLRLHAPLELIKLVRLDRKST